MSGALLKLLVLKTNRLEPLCKFYSSLGVEFAVEKHGAGPVHYAGTVGDAVLELYPLAAGAMADTTAPRLGFAVTDVQRVTAELESLVAKIVSMPRQTKWGLRAVLNDPDGRPVEIYERQ
ncbi:MAG TPA: VOC family protein [Pirellulales bacterium]|nr:VOC family protein [Pirellulales bacterium]